MANPIDYKGGELTYYYKVTGTCSGDKNVSVSSEGDTSQINVQGGGGQINISAPMNTSLSSKSVIIKTKLNGTKDCGEFSVSQDPYECNCNKDFQWETSNIEQIGNGSLAANSTIATLNVESDECVATMSASASMGAIPLELVKEGNSFVIKKDILPNKTLYPIEFTFFSVVNNEECVTASTIQNPYTCSCNTLQDFVWKDDILNELMNIEGQDLPTGTTVATFSKEVNECQLVANLVGDGVDSTWLNVTNTNITTAKVIPWNGGLEDKTFTFSVSMDGKECENVGSMSIIQSGLTCNCSKFVGMDIDTSILETSDSKGVGTNIGWIVLKRDTCYDELSVKIYSENDVFDTNVTVGGERNYITLKDEIPARTEIGTRDFELKVFIGGEDVCANSGWTQETSYEYCQCNNTLVFDNDTMWFDKKIIPQEGLDIGTQIAHFGITRERCKNEITLKFKSETLGLDYEYNEGTDNGLNINWEGLNAKVILSQEIAENDSYDEIDDFTFEVIHRGDAPIEQPEQCKYMTPGSIIQDPKIPCSCSLAIESVSRIFDDDENMIPQTGYSKNYPLITVKIGGEQCSDNISAFIYRADNTWNIIEQSKAKMNRGIVSNNIIPFMAPYDFTINDDYPPLNHIIRILVKNDKTGEDVKCDDYKVCQKGLITCGCDSVEEFFKPSEYVSVNAQGQLSMFVPTTGFSNWVEVLSADTAIYDKQGNFYSVCGALSATSVSSGILEANSSGNRVEIISSTEHGADRPNIFHFKVKAKNSGIESTGQISIWFSKYKDDGTTEPSKCEGKEIALTQTSVNCSKLPALYYQYGMIPCEGVTNTVIASSGNYFDKSLFWFPTLTLESENFVNNFRYSYSRHQETQHFLMIYSDVDRNDTDEIRSITIKASGYSEPEFTTDVESEKNYDTWVKGTGLHVCDKTFFIQQDICPVCTCEYVVGHCYYNNVPYYAFHFEPGIVESGTILKSDDTNWLTSPNFAIQCVEDDCIIPIFVDEHENVYLDSSGKPLGRDEQHPLIVNDKNGVPTFNAYFEYVEVVNFSSDDEQEVGIVVCVKTIRTINNEENHSEVFIYPTITLKTSENYEVCGEVKPSEIRTDKQDCPTCSDVTATIHNKSTIQCTSIFSLVRYSSEIARCAQFKTKFVDAQGNDKQYDWISYHTPGYSFDPIVGTIDENLGPTRTAYVEVYAVDSVGQQDGTDTYGQPDGTRVKCSKIVELVQEHCEGGPTCSMDESCDSFSFSNTFHVNESEFYCGSNVVQTLTINYFQIPYSKTGPNYVYLLGYFDELIQDEYIDCITIKSTTNSGNHYDDVAYFHFEGNEIVIDDVPTSNSKTGLFTTLDKFNEAKESNLDVSFHLFFTFNGSNTVCQNAAGRSKSVHFQMGIVDEVDESNCPRIIG